MGADMIFKLITIWLFNLFDIIATFCFTASGILFEVNSMHILHYLQSQIELKGDVIT